MSLRIVSPEEVAVANRARWGFYGLHGSGKTTFLSTIPWRLLVISADDENVKPLFGHRNIKVAKVNKWEDMAAVLQYLHNGLADPEVKSGKKPFFEGIAFDTMSRLQELAANMIVKYDPEAALSDLATYVKVAPRLPKGYDPWQQVGALAGEWLRYFERLPLHVIVMFQEQKREPKEGSVLSEPIIGPAMTPEALYKHIMPTLEIVGRLYVDTKAKPEGATLEGDGSDSTESGALSLDDSDLDDKPASPLAINRNVEETRYLLLGKRPPFLTKGPTHRLGYVVENPTWDKLAVALQPEPVAATSREK